MRTRAIIHLDRFKKNINSVKTRIGKNRLICIPVKADAYGHGAVKIAKTALEAEAFCFGVATVAEGLALRKGGIKAPILLFSQPNPDEIRQIVSAELIPFVSDAEFACTLDDYAKTAKKKLSVHIKIDTGMGRIGCCAKEAPALARQIADSQWLNLTGTATHLAVSDSTNRRDIDYTKEQIACFKKAVKAIRAAGIDPGIVHAANSGAVILHPDAWFDMVRPGILLYGYKSVTEYEAPLDQLKKLTTFKSLTAEPVMELRSTVVLIKKIKKGESVSYGRTWTAETDTLIGVLSIGYADGLPRLASNKWQVLIGGELYPLVGRISMDQCCVNLGQKTKINRWDEAVVFGSPNNDAAALAKIIGTIPYEITCNINKRVPRVYKN
jgi:alanine racemase